MEAVRNDFKNYRFVVTVEFEHPVTDVAEHAVYRGSSTEQLMFHLNCFNSYAGTRIIRVYYRGVIRSTIYATQTPCRHF